MNLTFWGAARQVTGSMFLLEVDEYCHILIDCGLDLDRKPKTPATEEVETAKTAQPLPHEAAKGLFPFDPSTITAVLLTHAHVDHSGNLPNLVREGFEGAIYTTYPTMALAELLLADSAGLNENKLRKMNKTGKGKRKVNTAMGINPAALYNKRHAQQTMAHFKIVDFGKTFRVDENVSVTFIPASHLLGAAHVIVEVTQPDGSTKTIGFSGDIGRYEYPLLVDPQPMPQVDYLVCESTYGARYHRATEEAEDILSDIITKTCIDAPGRLIIPAFSVGRTQALLYTLNQLYTYRDFPPIKVFSDSPLAYHSTLVYEKCIKYLNGDAQNFKNKNGTLFDFENLVYVKDMRQSKEISNYDESCIIISSSGMISGGRVEYHVEQNIQNPYCTIFMIGYAGEGTLAADLVNGLSSIKVRSKTLPVLANIEQTDVFSGHCDLQGLKDFISHQSKDSLKQVFLVHGDGESMDSLTQTLGEMGYDQVTSPTKGQKVEL